MAKQRKKREIPSGEMDMTSMIDCVFLLIIFFMLVTELKKQDIVQLKLPEADSAVEDKDSKLIINIQSLGEINFLRDEITIDQLRERLGEVYRRLPPEDIEENDGKWAKVLVKLRVDEKAEFRYVQQALKACIENKFYKTAFGALNDNN